MRFELPGLVCHMKDWGQERKSNRRFTLICFFLILVMPLCGQDEASIGSSQQESMLRIAEPLDSIVADLKNFIAKYRIEENIPGVGIALLYQGKIAWAEGFGVANAWSREPVTANTNFEVASISKVVTAYMALRLVDEGKLAIDRPLQSYLRKEWLPRSAYRDSVTLQHVLSHSSGLGKLSRDLMFRPGTAYYYAANGFIFAKEVLEEVTGEPFEELARRLVFAPLGMVNSSFIKKDGLTPLTASGHVRAVIPVVLFGILFAAAFLVIVLLGLIIMRLLRKSWRLKRSDIVMFVGIAFVLVAAALFIILGKVSFSEFAWLSSMCGFVSLALFLSLFYAARGFIVKKYPQKKGRQRVLGSAMAALIIAAIFLLATGIRNLPVPKWPAYKASPAGTLRTSAKELALFMNEISKPRMLKKETAEYLRTPRIKLSDDLSWGMGPGIFYSAEGYALWQWGQHIDFQSIMIVYPEHDFGVVVCTNNDLMNPDVAARIAQRALGGSIDPILRAIHLQYDYARSD